MNEDRKWYVVRTHANAEAKAAEHLRRQGFDTYLPCYRKERRHARRCDIVSAPLFPRYLFVAFDMEYQRWHAIRSTVGVERLIGGTTGPALLQNEVVCSIRAREDNKGFVTVNAVPRFSPGDRVRLKSGAFSTCTALLESMADRNRVAVLLDILGRRVRVLMDGAAVVSE
jgi:transcriptional antiterminator RfaH